MIHGGDRYRNQVNMDFSINVNPLGLPAGVRLALEKAMAEVEYYPDIRAQALTEAIAGHFGIAAAQVACGNGASELLMAVMRAFPLQKVLLPVPSFGGYPYAIEAAGITIVTYHMQEEKGFVPDEGLLAACEAFAEDQNCEAVSADPDGGTMLPTAAVILTDPNNPTGAPVPQEILTELLSICRRKNMLLLLDECFGELVYDKETYASGAKAWRSTAQLQTEKMAPCLILRAFTKSFAIPGVRLGYLLGSEEWIKAVRRQLPEWNISAFAQAAGLAAFEETQYLSESRKLIGRECLFLTEGLKALGYQVWPSATNFILFYRREDGGAAVGMRSGASLYEQLLERGTLIRDCSSYEGLRQGYYRIAVRTHEENVKLLRQLMEIEEDIV